jgi:tRNA(Ile)-lysidine synthase
MRLRRIEPVLRRALRGPCRVPPGAKILVAISGGADSTALLLGLSRVCPEFGLRLVAAHLHHGLRGVAAEADLEFARSLCARLDVPLSWARWNTRERMRRRGWSGHEGLRRLRREFLEQVARRAGAAAIATGHHAQDQLETVLMRLLRGAGLRGIGGMSARRGPWIRPLLAASRDQIEADLDAARQPWREDASNHDPRYLRGRIRDIVLPALLAARSGEDCGTRGPGPLARRVARGLIEVRAAGRYLDRRAGRRLRDVRIPRGEPGLWLDREALRSSPSALRRALLRRAWAGLGIAETLRQAHLDALEALLGARDGARIAMPGSLEAAIEGRWLRIGPGAPGIEAGQPAGPHPLEIPGRGEWGGLCLAARWVTGAVARRRLAAGADGGEVFAADNLKGALQLRVGRSDEWFVPFGAEQPRKLAEFLRRQRLPARSRRRPVVLADEAGILWIIGVRRSARAPLTPATRRALWVHHDR